MFYINSSLSGGVNESVADSVGSFSYDQKSQAYFQARVKKLALTNINPNSAVWDYDRTGDIIYAAADTDGIYVLDLSDPANPVHTTTVRMQAPIITGTHTGSNSSATLEDTTKSWEVDDLVYYVVDNLTQSGEQMIAASNTSNTVTGNRVGGGSMSWNTGDSYSMTRTLSTSCVDVKVIGTKLYAAARNINFNDPQPGLLCVYDISTPGAPVHLGSFQPPSTPVSVPPDGLIPPPAAQFDQNCWYQGIAYNPSDTNKLFLASQAYGLDVLDVTDPTAVSRLASFDQDDLKTAFPDWATTWVVWETSRIEFHDAGAKKWVAMANHGNGVMFVDVTDPANPTNPQWVDTPIPDNGFPGSPTQLRTRNLVIDSNWMFECNNDGDVESPERGLVVRDITDPESATVDTYYHSPIGVDDNDHWNGAGDEPIMGITKINDKALLANGQKGTAVFDVSTPSSPVYLGLFGTDTEDETNLYVVYPFTHSNGNDYVIYSDAKEVTQKHNLYIDLVKNT